jgi:hypothetical protein
MATNRADVKQAPKIESRLRTWLPRLAAATIIIILLIALKELYPIGIDWKATYSQIPEHWRNPYEIPTFTSPPWIMFLLPHAWLPIAWGNAINLLLNISLIVAIVIRYKGGWLLMLLIFTSPPFLDLVRTNNVDWIAMLALIVPAMWGLPILASKPQALGGVSIIWWKSGTQKIRLLIPLIAIISVSILIWGLWPLQLKPVHKSAWNFAPWPILLPLGLYMLYRAYKSDNAFLAAAATPFVVPYLAPYSIAGLMAFTGCKYRREVFIAYVAFWIYLIVESRRLDILISG